jgi:ElaA protein
MALEIIQARFTDPGFARCLEIRLAVFVGEQNVLEAEERDEYDETARHFLALVDGAPAGTARLLEKPEAAKITRVAVLRQYRGQGVGEALMRHIEAHHPARSFMLDAQVQAQAFYTRLGYAAQGDIFMEAGMAHVHMRKEIK